jgi:hypothetical protein
MRLILAAAVAAIVMAAPCFVASASADTMKNCAANWKTMSAADKAKTTYKDYSASCLKGGAAPAATPVKATTAAPVAAPIAIKSSGATPAGATGQCKDGSFTMSKTHSGACSKHGGVAKWL